MPLSTGQARASFWFALQPHLVTTMAGAAIGDIPIPLNYNGNDSSYPTRLEYALYRPATDDVTSGVWTIRISNLCWPSCYHAPINFGHLFDTPLARDFMNSSGAIVKDSHDDLVVFRVWDAVNDTFLADAEWWVLPYPYTGNPVGPYLFGHVGDIPFAFKAGSVWKFAVYTPSTGKYMTYNLATHTASSSVSISPRSEGPTYSRDRLRVGDVARFGDWDGNGTDEAWVYVPRADNLFPSSGYGRRWCNSTTSCPLASGTPEPIVLFR